MTPLLALALPAAATAPVAEAGLGLVAYVGETVELNGTGSTDADGDALTYAWTQLAGPDVTLQDASGPTPRFEVALSGTYTFELVVSDAFESSAPDTTQVVVPWEGLPGDRDGCASAPTPPGAGGALAAGALATLLARRRRAR
jgi:MYXO-CTERM domain-containing protein